MAVKSERSTNFKDEFRIIPSATYIFVALGIVIVAAASVFGFCNGKLDDHFYKLPILVPVALLGATVITGYVLLIGYINGDAGRRGMSRLAWTLLAVFVPNALGIVLYFILRKPRTLQCPQCSSAVEPGFGYCPRCRYCLNAVCPHCQRGVNGGDKFCPYCGGDQARGSAPSAPVPNQT